MRHASRAAPYASPLRDQIQVLNKQNDAPSTPPQDTSLSLHSGSIRGLIFVSFMFQPLIHFYALFINSSSVLSSPLYIRRKDAGQASHVTR